MALTFDIPANTPFNGVWDGQSLKFVTKKVTFDNSYPTGGEAMAASDFGLSQLYGVIPMGSNTLGNRVLYWNQATGKMMLFTALGTEATDSSDQSTIITNVVAVGI